MQLLCSKSRHALQYVHTPPETTRPRTATHTFTGVMFPCPSRVRSDVHARMRATPDPRDFVSTSARWRCRPPAPWRQTGPCVSGCVSHGPCYTPPQRQTSLSVCQCVGARVCCGSVLTKHLTVSFRRLSVCCRVRGKILLRSRATYTDGYALSVRVANLTVNMRRKLDCEHAARGTHRDATVLFRIGRPHADSCARPLEDTSHRSGLPEHSSTQLPVASRQP